jgi:predicted TPR repeat methyltransferase
LKDLYVGWSEVYDEEMVEGGYAYPGYIKSIFPHVGIAKDAKILDAGCGSGWPGQTLADIGYTNLHGLDYSPEMLAEAEKKKIYSSLAEADLKEPIDLETDSIDAILCVGFLARGHLGTECLDEFFRVLKPNGLLVCSIGENVFESMGFKDKIDQLEEDNIIMLDLISDPFVVMPNNEASAHSRMWVIRKV